MTLLSRGKKLLVEFVPTMFWYLFGIRRLLKRRKMFGFLSEEFFTENFLANKLCDIGGFGMTAKVITQYYGRQKDRTFSSAALFNRTLSDNAAWRSTVGESLVYSIPHLESGYAKNYLGYSFDVTKNFDFLLSIDLYPGYQFSLNAMPKTPLIIWLRDPKGERELEKIATVSSELQANNMTSLEQFMSFADQERSFFAHVCEQSLTTRRPITFVTNAHFLTPRGQALYGLKEFTPYFLPNPIHYPSVSKYKKTARPTVCLLGRIDPVKRPWICFELAKQFRNVEFLICGKPSYPHIMNPVIEKYRNLENLKFMGLVQGEQKEKILCESWILLNTSIHEGLPCSFLESFSCHTPILSSVDPDGLVSRFGKHTGDNLGDGLDDTTLEQFRAALDQMLSNRACLEEQGAEARKYIEQIYTFDAFEKSLGEILKSGIRANFSR